jgi:hypothetical protein
MCNVEPSPAKVFKSGRDQAVYVSPLTTLERAKAPTGEELEIHLQI